MIHCIFSSFPEEVAIMWILQRHMHRTVTLSVRVITGGGRRNPPFRAIFNWNPPFWWFLAEIVRPCNANDRCCWLEKPRSASFYKITDVEFLKSVTLIKIPYSVYHFRENPPTTEMKNPSFPTKIARIPYSATKFPPILLFRKHWWPQN